MKSNTLFALLLLLSGGLINIAQAQTVANQGFENWGVRGGIEVPTGWQTSDDLVEQIIPPYVRLNTGTVTKTTDAHGGQYAVQLQTIVVPPRLVPLFGLVALGTNFQFLATTTGTFGGQAYTARPARLEFYYKLSGPQALADMPLVQVHLSRNVNGRTVDVGYTQHQFSGLAATYTRASAPILYFSPLAPDSIHVVAWSGTTSPVSAGTTLLLDDLALVGGTVTAARAAGAEVTLTAFPNPSADGRFTLAASDPALLANPFTVADLTGRVVLRGEAASTTTPRILDLSAQPPGIYTLQLATAQGVVVRKLVIR